MPFRSAKKKSGQTLAGDTGQSNTARVARAGMQRSGTSSRRKRGSEFIETPILEQLVVSAMTLTTGTVTMQASQPGDGTIYWIADPNPLKPSIAQIKAGLEQGGGAADDDGNGAATDPFVAALTGLVGSTDYFFWTYQEGAIANSPIVGVVASTIDVVLSVPSSNTLTATTANLTATANAAVGTAYAVVDEDATVPTAAQIKAGLNGLGAAADFAGDTPGLVSTVIGATGLTAATLYNFWIVTEGPNGNFSNIVTNTFSTTA